MQTPTRLAVAPPPAAVVGGLLPAAEIVEVQALSWRGDVADAARCLGRAPLTTAAAPDWALFAAHDWLTGPARHAWGQPRARLGGPAGLAARAACGAAWEAGADRGPGAAWALLFAGQFWRPWQPLAAPSLAAFLAWAEPSTTRVAWCFRLGGEAGLVRLEMTLRAQSQDAGARRAFAAYMAAAGPLSRWLRRRLVRGLARHCGMHAS